MTREGAAAETEEERGEKESPAKGDVSPANNVFLMSFDSSSEAGRYQAPCMSLRRTALQAAALPTELPNQIE